MQHNPVHTAAQFANITSQVSIVLPGLFIIHASSERLKIYRVMCIATALNLAAIKEP